MNRHHNIRLSGFLVATLAISTILALSLTGCTPQATTITTIPTITAASPVATIQATAQATAQEKATLAPTLAATLSVSRAASLLILHTNDVSGYVDPCG